MQSPKTVTGGIRDLNSVHEISDLRAPGGPGALCSAIERKSHPLGGAGHKHSSQRQLSWDWKGCQWRPQWCVQRDDALQTPRQRHFVLVETSAAQRIRNEIQRATLNLIQGCATCTFVTMRGRQHHRRKERERETAGAGGEVCADFTGRWVVAHSGSEYLMVALWRRHALDLLGAVDNWCPSHHNQRLRSKREQSCRGKCRCSKTWCSMSLASSTRTYVSVA